MSVSAGNLDSLLGALVTTDDEYVLHVMSYTTTGTGLSEAISSITATVGTPDLGGIEKPGFSKTVSAFSNSAETITLTGGVGIDPQAASQIQPSVVLGCKNAFAAAMSRCSTNITPTCAPERSMAR